MGRKKEADSEEVWGLLDRKCVRVPVVDWAGRGEEEIRLRWMKSKGEEQLQTERLKAERQDTNERLKGLSAIRDASFSCRIISGREIHSDVTSPVVSHADTHFLYLPASATPPSPPSPRGV